MPDSSGGKVTDGATGKWWRLVTDQLREKFPKLAAMMDAAEYRA
jgi:hypothetical protein